MHGFRKSWDVENVGRDFVKKKFRYLGKFEDYKSKVDAGVYQLHRFPLGEVITEILERNGERVLMIHLLAGEKLESWKSILHDRLYKFATENRCNAVEAMCRLGLEPALIPMGFKRERVLLRRELQ